MLLTIDRDNRNSEHQALRAMFEARKRIFVDLLKWDIPVLAGRFEVDQFDDAHATYLIVADEAGNHLASARLLPTTRPALLDTVYPHLVSGEVPRGPAIFEVTRFCLSRDATAAERRTGRDRLLVGLVEHALASGIATYTGVADLSWFRQIQCFGWDCEALGEPMVEGGHSLTALRISIDASTPARLAATGIAVRELPHAARAA